MNSVLELLQSETAGDRVVTFARFMELALYAPRVGYYERSDRARFGPDGDFVTAPEMGVLFARALARQIGDVLERIPGAVVREIGAGSGQMAHDVGLALRRLGRDHHYQIVETSARLRAEQRRKLDDEVSWLGPEESRPMSGVIVANEVLDALPAHRVRLREGRWHGLGVALRDGMPVWREYPLDPRTAASAAKIDVDSLADGYTTELRPDLSDWMRQVSRDLERGVILFVDYGYPRAEFYHPQRSQGTAVAHQSHRSSEDLLRRPGDQDLTVFVDFTSVAEAADDNALEVLGYCSQGSFLLSCGILSDLEDSPETRAAASLQLRRLTLPGEMGERFQVMALGRDYAPPLRGFALANQAYRL